MAEREIIHMGNPVLKRRAEEVLDPTSDDLKALVVDMIDSMFAADGVGLAAPQIGVSQRVVVFCTPAEAPADASDEAPDEALDDAAAESSPGAPGDPARERLRELPITILINPEIEILDHDTEIGIEGCLSVPGLCGPVPRYRRIRYLGVTPDGDRIDRTVDGFHARVVQHECDHLDGILYPMRMEDVGLLAYVDEIKRLQDAAHERDATANSNPEIDDDGAEAQAEAAST